MSDLISREEAVDILCRLHIDNIAVNGKRITEFIKEIPSVTDTNVGNKWIPCSDRFPEKRDWYLAVFKEPDTGFIGLPYIADYLMGNHTAYTTKDGWIIKDCTDRHDCESLYHKNLECVAWMPLPEPYKGD